MKKRLTQEIFNDVLDCHLVFASVDLDGNGRLHEFKPKVYGRTWESLGLNHNLTDKFDILDYGFIKRTNTL